LGEFSNRLSHSAVRVGDRSATRSLAVSLIVL
jgi:hypothetical protein